MTTDTPSTSGEGVDVLSTFDELRWLAHPHLTAGDGTKFSDVRKRIADLITHAAYIVNYYDGADFDDLRNRVAACRATQGAHP